MATIGPATANKTSLKKLYAAGMSVARLNGSHNNLNWHSQTIALIRNTLPELPILLDIPGRKIRTAQLEYEPKFDANETIVLTTEVGHNGRKKVSINNSSLHKYLSEGDVILADDGTLRFRVNKILGRDIYCIAEVKGSLKSAKGINVPHVHLGRSVITNKDKKMIDFAIKNKVDFIGISFVESKKHIQSIKKLIKKNWPKIVAKVENQGGLDNLKEIAVETDVIMIDRGDLSNETNLESLAIFQKQIIKEATLHAKPVIVATEMLHSMINNPFPTKAEVVDISNAVIDGAAATMLSGETAIGEYPEKSVKLMSSVADRIADHMDKKRLLDGKNSIPLAFGQAISDLCNSLPITKVVVVTITGFAARMVSSQKVSQPIIAVSNNIYSARSFNILSGTKGIYVDIKFSRNNLDHVLDCLKYLYKKKEIVDSDLLLITAVSFPHSGQRMNMIQTHHVKALKKLFNW